MMEVKGSGNIVSKDIKVSSFVRLHLSGRSLVELHQSDEEKVMIETDDNLQGFFEVINSGRTLYVSSENKLKKPVYTKCTIKVFFRQIDVLYIGNDHANLVCPNEIHLSNALEIKVCSIGDTELAIHAPAIHIVCQSVGKVTLKGKCGEIKIKNQSEGDFNSTDLKAESLTIKNMAEGNVELFANKEITISHFGEGYVHYSGNALLKDVRQYGSGEIKHIK